MLLVVNCLNGFLEKCNSVTLRNIVEATDLMDNVHILSWVNPPETAFYSHKPDWQEKNREYEIALYPEIAQLDKRVYPVRFPRELPPEIYNAIKASDEVFIIGANTEDWILDIASEVWSFRIKPTFLYDAWFSVGPKGYHSDAITKLTRQFGANAFRSWERMREPFIKRREELQRALSEAMAKSLTEGGEAREQPGQIK